MSRAVECSCVGCPASEERFTIKARNPRRPLLVTSLSFAPGMSFSKMVGRAAAAGSSAHSRSRPPLSSGVRRPGRSLALSLQSVWATIEAGWLTALSGIQRSWADFLHAATRSLDGVPGMESTMPPLSEAAIRAGSAFYETAAAAREASSRADGLAASAAAAAGAATAPLASLQALRDAVKGSAEETETALGGATVAAGDLGEAVGKAGGASAAAAPELAMPTWSRPSARRSPAAPFMAKAIARSGRGCATAACGPRRGGVPVRFSPRPAQS